MSYIREVQVDDNFGPFAAFREVLGFVPQLVRAETLLPRVIEGQAKLENALLQKGKALSREQKERIVLVVAASKQDTYTVTARRKILSSLGMSDAQIEQLLMDYREAGLSAFEVTLMGFCLKLGNYAAWVQAGDIEHLRACEFDDDSIMEAVLATGFACFLCAMSAGLGPEPDFEPRKIPMLKVLAQPGVADRTRARADRHAEPEKPSYLNSVYRSPKTFVPFTLIQESHGFIPNFFRAQTSRPDLIEAEADAIVGILLPEDVLSRRQKEYILLVVSAANLNSYCVAVHCNLLRGLGTSPEEGDQIAVDYRQANLSPADEALLEFALKVGVRPSEICREDVDRLRALGFTDEQVLECVAVTAVNNFANTVQMGLGIVPDFEPPRAFEQMKVHLLPVETRPSEGSSAVEPPATAVEDLDAGLVASAQAGDLEAFEELIRRHSRSVYRTLVAILGDPEEAKDAMQDAFLSAFKHIAGFQGRSKFSTWLVSIARNTALQRLRDRKDAVSLDDTGPEGEEEFRPRQVRGWQDNPEQMYSKAEIQDLVERGIMRLPVAYRLVVMMRDIEELSADEVARELGLSVPAVKARLLRGRLMLREALTPHFAARAGGAGL